MAKYEDEFAHRFTATGADRVQRDMKNMGTAAGGVKGILAQSKEAFAFLGPRIAAAGDRLNEFSRENITLFQEAETVQHQLEKMWQTKGYSDQSLQSVEELARKMQDGAGISDELTKKTASLMASFDMKPGEITRLLPYLAAQADLFGADMGQVGTAIGKAFSTGNYGVLRRYGITLTDAQMAELKLAEAMVSSGDASQAAAGKAKALDIVTASLAENTPDLWARLETAKGRADRLKETLGDVREQMGAGAAGVKAYGETVLYSLVRPLSEGHEGLLKTAGATGYLGGQLIKGAGTVGSLLHDWTGFSASLKILKSGKDALRVATAAETAAEAEKAVVAGREAAALGKVGDRVGALTGRMGGLQKAGSWLTGGLGFGGMMGADAGMLLRGGAGAGAALSSVTLVAGSAILGWEVGSAIANWLEKETGYQEKGGDLVADYFLGAGKQEAWAGQAATQAEIDVMRARARGERTDSAKSGQQLQQDHALRVATVPGYGAYSFATNPRSSPTVRPTPGGDLTVRIPGDQVVTQQGIADRRALGG